MRPQVRLGGVAPRRSSISSPSRLTWLFEMPFYAERLDELVGGAGGDDNHCAEELETFRSRASLDGIWVLARKAAVSQCPEKTRVWIGSTSAWTRRIKA